MGTSSTNREGALGNSCASHAQSLSFVFVEETECVIKICGVCQRPYRTYVANTECRLPDGGSVFYRDPQIMCPLCDPEGYGEFMNTDLFPELQKVDVVNDVTTI